jgi:hypothetical protein
MQDRPRKPAAAGETLKAQAFWHQEPVVDEVLAD